MATECLRKMNRYQLRLVVLRKCVGGHLWATGPSSWPGLSMEGGRFSDPELRSREESHVTLKQETWDIRSGRRLQTEQLPTYKQGTQVGSANVKILAQFRIHAGNLDLGVSAGDSSQASAVGWRAWVVLNAWPHEKEWVG